MRRRQDSVDNNLRRQSQPPSAASCHCHGKYHVSSRRHAPVRFNTQQGSPHKLCRILLFTSLCFNGNPISFSTFPNHYSRLDPKPQRHAPPPSTTPCHYVPSPTACFRWAPPSRPPLVLLTEASTCGIAPTSSTTTFIYGRNG